MKMITNTYKVDLGFEVTEYDFVLLTCTCPAFRRTRMESEQVAGAPSPIGICAHLLDVARLRLDEGFLGGVTAVMLAPWVGWSLEVGGFTKAYVHDTGDRPGFMTVSVPAFVAPEAPIRPFPKDVPGWPLEGLAEVGLVRKNAGRADLAETIAPFWSAYGFELTCVSCGKTASSNEGTLNEPWVRRSALRWGVWANAHGGACWECSDDDLIPRV